MGTIYVHTNIVARDWQKLVHFYEEVFECVYNRKFNMWSPLRHIDEYEMISKNYNIYKIKY